MLLESQYTLINQIQFYLLFDNDVKKLITIKTGDIVSICYRKNNTKTNIKGKVEKIGCNFNASLGRVDTSAYIKIDGSGEYDGYVEYIKPSQVLDVCMCETTSDTIINPVCSVDNIDQKVILLRENEVGLLQYSKDGLVWRSCVGGETGKSAYEVALDLGFKGTEQEWIDSLKGKDGKDGLQGKTGPVGPSIAPYVVFANADDARHNYDLIPAGEIIAVLPPTEDEAHLYLKPEACVCKMADTRFDPPDDHNPSYEIEGYQHLGVIAQGPKGESVVGPSAYDLAKKNGDPHTDSLESWLASLHGAKGDTGKDAFEYAQEINGSEYPYDSPENWLGSLKGADGADGESAYEVAKRLQKPNTSTEDQWITSLKGMSAYEVAKSASGMGDGYMSETTWLASLKGDPGESAYQTAKRLGKENTSTEDQWIVSLQGKDGEDGATGKSAYESAKETSGHAESFPSESEWVQSLKGKDGEDGKSAFQIAQTLHGSQEAPYDTEEHWINYLKGTDGTNGTNGKSAFEIAQGLHGSPEFPFDTEENWINSLKGATGKNGENGTDGESAFEIAKRLHGGDDAPYDSEANWINSLKGIPGTKGTDGTNGESAYEIAKRLHGNADAPYDTEAHWIESLKGAKGDNGNNGSDGNPGESAYQIAKRVAGNLDTPPYDTEDNWVASLKGKDGSDGKTPVKGEDYFTDQDIKEFRDKVTGNTEPYTTDITTSTQKTIHLVLCCGHTVTIESDGADGAKIKYHMDGKEKELTVATPSWIMGGTYCPDSPVRYETSSIIINSGKVSAIFGGNYGYGSVGHSTIVANGGEVEHICGGGKSYMEGKGHYENTVGRALIIVNNGATVNNIFGGTGSGAVSDVNEVEIEINGGNISGYITAGGSNATTLKASVEINGGTIGCIQGCNRGHVCNIEMTVNNGTITKMYAGGEPVEDVTATYDACRLDIKGGTITNLYKGKNGEAEDATKVSGKYTAGVIQNDETQVASDLNLTPYKE